MAAPLYSLIVVNERARFQAGLNYNSDRFMENIIKNQPRRCYVFLGTILVTGIALLYGDGLGLGAMVTNWNLVIKEISFLALLGLLSYVHFGLQPQIEALIEQIKPDNSAPAEVAAQIRPLRMRRKRLAAICLFLVITAVVMGVRVMTAYNIYLALLLIALAALFAWRVFRAPIPYGWF